jgi:hypothetical protein
VIAVTAPEAFAAFCAAAPIRQLPHDGVDWKYRVTGDGTQGLLLLPG